MRAQPAAPEPAPTPASDESVVVTATRTARRLADVPVATEVISHKEIERAGAENAAEALQTHAGVELVPALGGAGVRLRGLDSKYVLVLVDGQRVAGRLDGAIDMKRFAAQDIERIEIVRGSGSALYGSDAIGGVINIITRRPQAPLQADLHASYGSRNQFDLDGSAGALFAAGSAKLGAGFHRADAYDLQPSDPATTGSTFDEPSVSADLELTPTSQLSLRTGAAFRARTQRAIDQGAGNAVFDREQRNQELRAWLRPRYSFDPNSALSVSASYTQVNDRVQLDQRQSNDLDRAERNVEHLLELGTQFETTLARHGLTAGIEGSQNWMQSPRIRGGRAERSRLALYAQDEWKVLAAPALSLVPGARLDADTQFGTHFSPKLAARIDPFAHLIVRASFGLGFRAPDFKEQYLRFENPGVGYVVEGNPQLKPETSRGVELGAEYEPIEWLWLSAEASRTDLRGMITEQLSDETSALGSQLYRYQNIDRAYTQELEVRARIRSGFGLGFELEYVLGRARDQSLHRALEGRATQRGSLALDYRWRALAAEAGLLLVGRRPFYRDTNDDGVDERQYARPYAALRLRISKDWGQLLSTFAGVDNALDAGDADFTRVAPRTFYAGLTARL